jgi:hypothetical protein
MFQDKQVEAGCGWGEGQEEVNSFSFTLVGQINMLQLFIFVHVISEMMGLTLIFI